MLSRNGDDDLPVGAAAIAAASTMLNVVAEEEEEEEELRRQRVKKIRQHGGSRTGKAEDAKRDFVGAYKLVMKALFQWCCISLQRRGV